MRSTCSSLGGDRCFLRQIQERFNGRPERTAEQIWIMPTAEPKPTPAPEKQEPEKQEPDELTPEPNEPTPEPTPVPDMPLVNIDGWDFVAIISIPALDKEYSVRNEWSRKGAKYSPCRYVGSVYTNDLVICAHNQMSLFGRLNELREGDQVILVDMDGRVYTYHVVLTEEIGPFDVEDMISSGYDLSLFTCTIRGRGRTTVRCTRDA